MDPATADADARHGWDVRALFAFSLLLPACALADGPHIALHATQGGYTVTVFSAPDPLVTGPVELALLVQKGEGQQVVPLRGARGALKLGARAPIALTLTPGASGSRDLLGGAVVLAQAGTYGLTLEIPNEDGVPVRFTGTLPVADNHGRRDAVVWSTMTSLVLALLFLVNQYAKQRLRTAHKT